MIALVDGERCDTIPVSDSAVLRGDGCFEAVRCYEGRLFALEEHIERLERSARLLGIEPPDREALEQWCVDVAEMGGEGTVRIVLTRGDVLEPSGPRCVVLHHPLPDRPDTIRLLPVVAPWHPAGRAWELSGAKSISYAPNLAAGRLAREKGFDDALLVSDEMVVLEGPTFSVAWVNEGVIETPALSLGILDSITRRHVMEAAKALGMGVREVESSLEVMLASSETFAVSTMKEVTPIVGVGESSFDVGPVSRDLALALWDQIARATGVRPKARWLT